MFDAFGVTAPPSTLRSAPAVGTASLPAGTVTWVGVQFPTGCGGLVHARILRSGHQVWPSDLDEDISSDGFIVSWRERYSLVDPPYAFRLEVWNDDDTFPHLVTVFFEVEESRPGPAAPAAPSLLQRLQQLVSGS